VAGGIAVNEALMEVRRRRPERMVSLDEDVKTEEDSFRARSRTGVRIGALYKQAELKDILTRTIQGLPPSFGLYLS